MPVILQTKSEKIRIPGFMLALGILIMIALVVFAIIHFSEAEKFVQLLSRAEPKWLVLALILQMGTCFCAGCIWDMVVKTTGYQAPLSALARLSVEKLSIDQLLPTGGVSGNLMVIQTMKRLGLPDWLAIEAMLVDIFSHYIAYGIMAVLALIILWFNHSITRVICYLVAIFTIIVIVVPTSIFWLFTHRNSKLPSWLLRFKFITNISETVKLFSPERILLPELLGWTTILNMAIFFLDAATLWTMMRITNYPARIISAFVAIVISTIAGTVSFLPGGMGGFEAGSVMVLILFKVPIEVALTSTLLLRGFTLWIPLIPGILLARNDVKIKL